MIWNSEQLRLAQKYASHEIQADVDYIGAVIFETATPSSIRHKKDGGDHGVAPAEIIADVAPDDAEDGLSDAPPPISGYRIADVQGMSCWNCGHFTPTGDDDDDGVVDGVCNLFEAHADGANTCDRFTPHADLFRQQPHTSWTEDMQQAARDSYDQRFDRGVTSVEYSDSAVLNEVVLSGDASEEDGLIWKDILRTGEWDSTPTTNGVIKKKLRIIRDGFSDPTNGIIALSEIYRNFNEGAVPYVTVPLSDDLQDHKNIARLNTGFVRKLRMAERDGLTVLQGGFDFTEPDVKEKVLRGTIPDCSAGVPFGVTRRSDSKTFGAVLDHVCLTRRPFIDNLQPFGLAAADSDSEDLPVERWEQTGTETEEESEDSENQMSFRQLSAAVRSALSDQLRLGPEYLVEDITGTTATINHKTSGASWTVPFRINGNSTVVASVDSWKLIENEQTVTVEPEPVAASDLRRAQELRELQFSSQPTSQTGGTDMSVLSLDGVELSDEARARIQSVIDENHSLKRSDRENRVATRIQELEGMGLKDRPGALKLYREVMLSDDGGLAVVLFADNQDESKREPLTALGILDRFIAGLTANGEGSVQFSDQAFQSGNDNKPPEDASGEKLPLEDRVKASKEALYGKRNRRK
jgi:hypothetical protein